MAHKTRAKVLSDVCVVVMRFVLNTLNHFYRPLHRKALQRLTYLMTSTTTATMTGPTTTPSAANPLAISSTEPLAQQLDDVFNGVDTRLSALSPELVANCRHLQHNTHNVIRLAKQYDYNSDTEANGYWTFTRLVIKFGKLCLVSPANRHHCQSHLIPVSIVLKKGLELCHDFHNESEISGNGPNLFACPPEKFTEMLAVFKFFTPHLHIIYGSYGSYWLCHSMRKVMNGFTTLMAIYSGNSLANWWHSSKSVWDREYRAHTVAYIAQNATVEFVKSFWGLTEYSLVKNTLPALAATSPKHNRDIYIPRQSRWRISADRAEVIDCEPTAEQTTGVEDSTDGQHQSKATDSKVRCLLLQSADTQHQTTDALVLHIHGGGFVSQSPDSQEVYLREWAHKLDGVPILSVDYTLSPEGRYPTALQQILDCYLWLISGDVLVREVLGFHPKKIVICGDSAGGNLSCALCLVLKDIRKQLKKSNDFNTLEHWICPKGIVCFYTPFMLQTRGSPSRIMCAVDTLLPLGVLLSCLEAYAPDDGPEEDSKTNLKISAPEVETEDNPSFEFTSLHFLPSSDKLSDTSTVTPMEELLSDVDVSEDLGKDFVLINYDDVPPDEDLKPIIANNWSSKWCNSFIKLKTKLLGADEPPITPLNPWYRQTGEELDAKLIRVNAATNNAYISPLASKPDFDDVALYLIGLNYDACLDDSIQMAKLWKGPVVLDILDELPHGFLNFILLSDEGRRGSLLCVDRIKQALN